MCTKKPMYMKLCTTPSVYTFKGPPRSKMSNMKLMLDNLPLALPASGWETVGKRTASVATTPE